MKGLDLSKFKKVSGDEHHTIMEHADGHQMKIAHKPLSPKLLKQLNSLPMKDGGEAKKPEPSPLPTSNAVPDEDKIKKFREKSGFANGGEIKKKFAQNPDGIKMAPMGVRAAKGGKVDYEAMDPVDAEELKPLEIEKLETPEPKEHVEAEAIPQKKPKHPVDAEPIKMAEGGAPFIPGTEEPNEAELAAPPSQSTPVSTAPQQPTVVINNAPEKPKAQELGPQTQMQSKIAPQPSGLSPAGQAQQELMGTAPGQGPGEQGSTPTMGGAYQSQLAGLQQSIQPNLKAAQAAADTFKQQAASLSTLMQDYQQKHQQIRDDVMHTIDDIKNAHIDPNQYLGRMDTMDRIGTGAALMLGGLGGQGGPNQVLEFINRQIDRDIDAQKAELGKKHNILTAYQHMLGDDRAATDMSRLVLAEQAKAQLDKIAATAKNQLVVSNALQAKGALDAQFAPLYQQQALREMLQTGQNLTPAMKLNLMQQSGMVSGEQYNAATKELTQAENARRLHDDLMRTWDAARQEQTLMHRAGRAGFEGPNMAKLRSMVLPLIHDQMGRVNEFEHKSLQDLFPGVFNKESTNDSLRKGFETFLLQKQSTPVLEGMLAQGVNATVPRQAPLPPEQQKVLDWAKKNPNHPAAKQIFKKLNITE